MTVIVFFSCPSCLELYARTDDGGLSLALMDRFGTTLSFKNTLVRLNVDGNLQHRLSMNSAIFAALLLLRDFFDC